MKEKPGTACAEVRVPLSRSSESSIRRLFPSEGKPGAWVDYLVDQIEKVTDDTHSRRMFRMIAASLPDGVIFEALSQIKHGEGIRNAGAVFVAAAKKWAAMRKRKKRLSRYRPREDVEPSS